MMLIIGGVDDEEGNDDDGDYTDDDFDVKQHKLEIMFTWSLTKLSVWFY